MNIREKMFLEIKDKDLFKRAGDYALEYAENSLDRNVFPDKEAIKNLNLFNEDLPDESFDAVSIINLAALMQGHNKDGAEPVSYIDI